MDRIDIWMNVSKVDYDQLAEKSVRNETSETVARRIAAARKIQTERFRAYGLHLISNSEMTASDIERVVAMEEDARSLLKRSAQTMGISGRAFHRTIKVAQTIADLCGNMTIRSDHILEALQYRMRSVQ